MRVGRLGFRAALVAAVITALPLQAFCAPEDPLPSWNDGPAKKSIIDFVTRVTAEGGSESIPPAERIAAFDNDGTLWCEQPVYAQIYFTMHRVRALAGSHPEWKNNEPYRSAIDGDLRGLGLSGEPGLVALMAATHSGVTPEEFREAVRDWLKTARHPMLKRPFDTLVYQPMLEVLAYLRANGFKTFIVSGGGAEFMRAFAERVYGIPPQQVIGSTFELKVEMRNGEPVLIQQGKIDFIDDKEGKPIGIQKFIGRRPVMALGNSDGDLQMLQWTTAGAGPRFALIVHHTDAQREYAYDRDSPVGRLDKALNEAVARGWTVVDMRSDWKTIFPALPAAPAAAATSSN